MAVFLERNEAFERRTSEMDDTCHSMPREYIEDIKKYI